MHVSKNIPRALMKHPKVLKTPMPVSKNRPRHSLVVSNVQKVLKTPMPVSNNRPRDSLVRSKVLKTHMYSSKKLQI